MIEIKNLKDKTVVVYGKNYEHAIQCLMTAKNDTISNADFKLATISDIEIKNLKFIDCDFRCSVFSNLTFINCDFNNCKLNGVIFGRSKFLECNFTDTSLESSELTKSTFEKSIFNNCIFSKSECKATCFFNCKFERKCYFHCSDMTGINLSGTDMTGMFITNSFMRNFVYDSETIMNWLSHLVVAEYLYTCAINDIKKRNAVLVWFFNQDICDESVIPENFDKEFYDWMTKNVGIRYKHKEPIHPIVLEYMRKNYYTKY